MVPVYAITCSTGYSERNRIKANIQRFEGCPKNCRSERNNHVSLLVEHSGLMLKSLSRSTNAPLCVKATGTTCFGRHFFFTFSGHTSYTDRSVGGICGYSFPSANTRTQCYKLRPLFSYPDNAKFLLVIFP